jgi:hypothetical protein
VRQLTADIAAYVQQERASFRQNYSLVDIAPVQVEGVRGRQGTMEAAMLNAVRSQFQIPTPVVVALTLSFATLALCAASVARGAQGRETANSVQAKRPAVPRILTDTKTNLQLTDASLSQMLDKVIPASSPLSYVVEDLPIKATADLAYHGPLIDALDRIADLFDYTWRVRKGACIVFEKRFANLDEHPQLILPELLRIARDMNTTLKGIPYQSGVANDGFNIRAFYLLLTPQQVSRLERKESLGAKDLSVTQRNLMVTALYSSQYQSTVTGWQDLEAQLAAMPKSALTLTQSGRYGDLTLQYPSKDGRPVRKTMRLF